MKYCVNMRSMVLGLEPNLSSITQPCKVSHVALLVGKLDCASRQSLTCFSVIHYASIIHYYRIKEPEIFYTVSNINFICALNCAQIIVIEGFRIGL